jgi:F-type H+-transporting ATPase subunit delta
MVYAGRWADAFAAVCGESLDEGLAALKVIAGCTERLPGPVTGTSEALQLERMILSAVEKTGGFSRGAELAARFTALMIKKGRFSALHLIIEEAEKIADERKGILTVVIESVTAIDKKFEDELKQKLLQQGLLKQGLLKQQGAWNYPVPKEVRLISCLVPELLGGYRLRMDSEVFDASLRGQIQSMAAELNAAALPA